MAEVWLARFQGKHGFEKLVALKTILPLYAADADFRKMFLDEAAIASRIEHTNVAQILDLGEHEGILYLVMEWVEGDSVSRLERAVQQAGSIIPQALALRIASDACAGLHAAHELCDAAGRSLGVVHRDVSPQNILVNAKGIVKVIDFGIAKARDRASEETRTGVFKGKLHYMAPEQALGKAVDHRADVWAVAAVLYRLLAQRAVYDKANRVETLRDLTSNAPVLPLPPHVAKSIANIIYKALSFRPEARQASCAELQTELDQAVRAESLYATTAELSAFVNLHLGAHLDARRQAIAVALQAGAEPATLPRATFAESSDVDLTLVHARATSVANERSELELLSEPTRLWQPTPHESSFTVGSTSLDAVRPSMMPSAKHRRRVVLGFALCAAFLLLFAWRQRASNDAQIATQTVLSAAATAPALSTAPAEPATAEPARVDLAPSPAPAVSVVSLESLALSPNQPKPRAAASGPPARPKSKRKLIDDGF